VPQKRKATYAHVRGSPRRARALAEGTVHRTPTSCAPAVSARGREDTVGSSTRPLAARLLDLLEQNTKLTQQGAGEAVDGMGLVSMDDLCQLVGAGRSLAAARASSGRPSCRSPPRGTPRSRCERGPDTDSCASHRSSCRSRRSPRSASVPAGSARSRDGGSRAHRDSTRVRGDVRGQRLDPPDGMVLRDPPLRGRQRHQGHLPLRLTAHRPALLRPVVDLRRTEVEAIARSSAPR
jgi:hypothetical protein